VNWLGAGFASLVAALLGALVGAFAHFEGRRHGIDFPPIVGIVTGLAAALASTSTSGLRGMLVASLAVWAAALAEVLESPARGVVADIIRFNDRLGFARGASYVGCAVVTLLLASRARPQRAPLTPEPADSRR